MRYLVIGALAVVVLIHLSVFVTIIARVFFYFRKGKVAAFPGSSGGKVGETQHHRGSSSAEDQPPIASGFDGNHSAAGNYS